MIWFCTIGNKIRISMLKHLNFELLLVFLLVLAIIFKFRNSNEMASIKEIVAYIFGIDDPERKVWSFTPETVDLFSTNRIYESVLQPNRAITHDILLKFDERIKVFLSPGRIDGNFDQNMLEGLRLSITIKHCGTQKIFKDVIVGNCKPTWFYEDRTNNIARVACVLYSFCPHIGGSWHYRDQLQVQMQVLCPPRCRLFGTKGSAQFFIEESYPFR